MQEKSQIKQNILLYIDFIGISKYDFYRRTGITRGVLDQPTGISEDNIAKFIAYFAEVNIEWLITGKGNMLKKNVTPMCNPNMKPQLIENVTPNASNPENVPPIVPPNETNTFNPSDPKFTANFSADDESNACPLCVEKERLISALNEIIRSKDATIRTKDEVIRCQNEYIDKLSEKREGEIPASAS